MAFTPYSVSPFWRDQSVWPKPTKNWVTFMWNFFAVAKCPASCSMIEKSRAKMKMSQPSRVIRPTLPPCASRLRPGPRHGSLGHRVHDSQKGEAARPEGLDAHFVRRVVDRWGGPADGARLARQPDGGERLLIQRLEGPPVRGGPVDGGRRPWNPVRPAQRESDRDPHIRRARLGDG